MKAIYVRAIYLNFFVRLARIFSICIFCGKLFAVKPEVSAFAKAACDGDLKQVKELLEKDPSLLNKSDEGSTPLASAVFLARTEVVKFLLVKGADVELPTFQSEIPKGSDEQMPQRLARTPLHLAAYQGYSDIVKLLLVAKANPSAASEDGTTVLHTAAAKGRSEIVELLINAKADANVRDKDGATPLHYSADQGLATCAALIAGGGDIHAKAERGLYAGKTPLDLNSRLDFFASLAPNWAKSDIDMPQHLTADARKLKYLSCALREFAAKYGAYPNEKTAAVLEKSFNGAVRLGVITANDFISQMLLTSQFPDSVRARSTVDNPNTKPNWTYSYLPGGSLNSHAERPVVVLPLLAEKTQFNTALLEGKALVLFADGSVRHFSIEADGRVLRNGRDLFDPNQPYWEGKAPTLKWPAK